MNRIPAAAGRRRRTAPRALARGVRRYPDRGRDRVGSVPAAGADRRRQRQAARRSRPSRRVDAGRPATGDAIHLRAKPARRRLPVRPDRGSVSPGRRGGRALPAISGRTPDALDASRWPRTGVVHRPGACASRSVTQVAAVRRTGRSGRRSPGSAKSGRNAALRSRRKRSAAANRADGRARPSRVTRPCVMAYARPRGRSARRATARRGLARS